MIALAAALVAGLLATTGTLVWALLELVKARTELADLRVRQADDRTAAEDRRADVAELQTQAAVEEASEAADTVAAIHEQAARNGGVVDPGDLWDAGVHADGDQGGHRVAPVPAGGPAPSAQAGPSGARRLPGR